MSALVPYFSDAHEGAEPVLYLNNGDSTFTDDTYASRIGTQAILLSGIAAKFIDYDNDGWTDILQLNGAMLENVTVYHSEISYKEPLLMFRNLGLAHPSMTSSKLGPDFWVRPVAGRGLATADFDHDGDTDIAVNNRADSPELLRNDGGNANHWLEVLLIGTKSSLRWYRRATEIDRERFLPGQTGGGRRKLYVGGRLKD